ncbi:MAG: family 2 glycosyl transferase [Sulfitobacter sp.]
MGRPESIAGLLPWIARQTIAPSDVVFVVTGPEDLPDLSALPDATVIYSKKGLPKQRNCGLDAVQDKSDAVFFIDDDYVPTRSAISGVINALDTWPDAAGFTGKLLADGIRAGGLPIEQASELITQQEGTAGHDHPSRTALAMERNLVGLYGCNMAYRSAAIGVTRFDERLPLYAWQEDVDFAARVPGEKLLTDAFTGVHCGTTRGRETSGQRLGYSQIANAFYLMRKGSLPKRFALRLAVRNILSNHAKMLRPEPWIDRKGRARGNWIAMRDILTGRCAPERILEMA